MICNYCGRDLDAIGQDNISFKPGVVVCEDCANAGIEFGGKEYKIVVDMLERVTNAVEDIQRNKKSAPAGTDTDRAD